MLAAFEELWAASEHSSQRLSPRLGLSSAPLAAVMSASSSAASALIPAVPAAGAGPLTPRGSPPSSRSAAAFSRSSRCSRLQSSWPSPVVHVAPAQSPSVPVPSHY